MKDEDADHISCIRNLADVIVKKQATVRGYKIVVSIFQVPDIGHNVNETVRDYIELKILDFKFHHSNSEMATCSSEDFDFRKYTYSGFVPCIARHNLYILNIIYMKPLIIPT